MEKFHFIRPLWSVRKSGWCPSEEADQTFFNLDPQRWAESGGVCGFRAERQRKALLISILFCRALLHRASRLAFRRRAVKDYNMNTRRNLVPSKGRRQELSVLFYRQNQLAHGLSFHLARCLIENAPSGDCIPATLHFSLKRLRLRTYT